MSKKNKKIQLPKRSPLLYLLLILVPIVIFLAIAIPVEYVSTYKSQKVYEFKSYVYQEVEHEHEEDEDHEHVVEYERKEGIVWGDKNTITDFDLYLYCNEYKDGTKGNTNGTISFGVFGVKNENTNNLNITKFTVRLGVFNTWLSLNKESTSKTITLVDNARAAIKDGSAVSSTYNPSISISGVTDLPAKGPLPFTTVKKLPVYAYISYTIKQKGETITKEFVLEFSYDDYMIEKTIIDAGTVNETFIKPSAGGIQK